MKKSIALMLVSLFLFSSCGPRRYKCGPYRKCENKVKKSTKQDVLKTENIYNVTS